MAGLTILRAHAISGSKDAIAPIGSFVEWSRMVRDALIWLGMPDPCETMAKTRAGDPRLVGLSAVIDQWEQAIGDGKRKASAEIIKLATDRDEPSHAFMWPEFRDALLVVAGSSTAVIDSRRLGKWLSSVESRIVGGRRLVRDGSHAGVAYWRLDLVERDR